MIEFDVVGYFSQKIIKLLNLDITEGTKILLSAPTLEHIKNAHPEITGDHKKIISDIIKMPTGVSIRKNDGSIAFYKKHKDGKQYYLELPIRSSGKGEYFVRTLHIIKTKRLNWYVQKGKILSVDKINNI